MKAISACLCGVNCKYNGHNNAKEHLSKNKEDFLLICPELEAGLGVPRPEVEIVGEIVTNAYDDLVSGQIKVVDKKGKNYSKAFITGANIVLERVLDKKVKTVILKDGSPSCGVYSIASGQFNGSKIEQKGVLAALLEKHGIEVLGE